MPLHFVPVGFPAAVTYLPDDKCKMWHFVSGRNIEENSQNTVLKIYADST